MPSAIQVRVHPHLKKEAMRILRMRGHTLPGFIKIVLGEVVSTEQTSGASDDLLHNKARRRVQKGFPTVYSLSDIRRWNKARR